MSNFTIERRQFILGALLAPLALTVGESVPKVIGADIGSVGMATMGDLNGTQFVTVPRESTKLVEWLVMRGWEVSDKQLDKDVIHLELPRLIFNHFNSEVKPDGRED